MRHSTSLLRLTGSIALFVFGTSATGCQLLAGLGGEEPLAATGGAGGAGATGGAGGTGGSGGTTGSTDTGGSGGTGLTGPCSPGEEQACYTGPAGTDGTGECRSGNALCTDEGMWGACDGEVVPQIESCATPTDEDCNSYDCTVWVKVIPGEVYGEAVAVDAQGNVLVALAYYAATDLGDGMPVVPVGNSDMVVLKYDKAGNLTWKKTFPVAGEQYLRAIAVDAAGNIAIGGESDAAVDYGTGMQPKGSFVIKLSPEGVPQWTRVGTAVGSGPFPTFGYLDFDSKGNVFAGGSAAGIDLGVGAALISGDPQSFFIAKLDGGTGAPMWSKISKGGAVETISGLQVDPSDSPVLTGTWDGMYIGLASATQTPPNDHYNCCGQDAPFLLRLDPDGVDSDAKMLAGFGPLSASVTDMDVDKFGAAAMVGSFSGVLDVQSGPWDAGTVSSYFVIRDQTSGFNQWSKVLIGNADIGSGADRVAVDGSDNMVMSGTFYGPADFGGGPLLSGSQFLLKLDKDGNHLWSRGYSFGDGGIKDIAAGTLEDETAIIGTFYGSADLGTGLIEAQQGFFIARLGK